MGEPVAKKFKTAEDGDCATVAKKFKAAEGDDCANLFDGFEVKRILSNDVKSKKVHIIGLFHILIILVDFPFIKNITYCFVPFENFGCESDFTDNLTQSIYILLNSKMF